jgi:plasmid maintenance system killer protein
MILSFRSKALARLYLEGETRGLNAEHIARLRHILSMLDVARSPDDLRLPSFRLHGSRAIASASGRSPSARAGAWCSASKERA